MLSFLIHDLYQGRQICYECFTEDWTRYYLESRTGGGDPYGCPATLFLPVEDPGELERLLLELIEDHKRQHRP